MAIRAPQGKPEFFEPEFFGHKQPADW